MRVPERYENDAVVGERRHTIKDRSLLSSTKGTGGYKRTSILTRERPLQPKFAGFVPDSLNWMRPRLKQPNNRCAYLPLSREVSVASGDAEKECVVFDQGIVNVNQDGVIVFRGCTHLGEDLLGECFRDSKRYPVSQCPRTPKSRIALVYFSLATSPLDTGFLSLRDCKVRSDCCLQYNNWFQRTLGDMSVHRVDDDRDPRGRHLGPCGERESIVTGCLLYTYTRLLQTPRWSARFRLPGQT
jgi:hypothetical protein